MSKLEQHVALVTGASGGIGSAICRSLAAEGASLILHYHSRAEQVQALKAELDQKRLWPGQRHLIVQADLGEESNVLRLISQGIECHARLDLLVNNAGWTRVVKEDDLQGLDDELIDQTLRMKIHAPLYLCRAARPYLQASGHGQIINITSVAGIAAKGSSIIYAAANAALSNLTRSLARALAPEIRVNAVAPGFVGTGFAWPDDDNVKAHVAQRNHIGRTVEPEEVAAAVRFLACEAPAITGEEIVIDGGIGRLGVR